MAKNRISKSLAKIDTPRGAGTAMTPLSPYAIQVNYAASRGIVQGNGADWFGPLNPMAPMAPPEVAGRQFDYIVGTNLQTTPRGQEIIGFPMLRMLADSYDLVRLVVETRKDQLCKLKFKIRVKDGEQKKPLSPAKKAKVEIKPDQQAAIDEITALLRRPDGFNRWRPWLRGLLEDLFVIDAPALYCQRNRGGQLISLKQMDGATIKVVIDDWGRTPYEPVNGALPPAYQQVLKGFPAVNYTVRDVIYRPYNRRVHKIYGYSPVEQIIMTVNIAMRRQAFQLAYYTEGNVPEALIGTPDAWTPEQVATFQKSWDQMFTGNLAQRRHAKFVPGGVAKTYIPTKEPDLKNPMDDWLARIVCFAFSISPQALIAMMNRATAGTAAETAKEEGIEPVKEWVAEIINDVIENEFDRDDLEFAFDEEIEVDQEKQKDIEIGYAGEGVKTINQARDAIGLEPDPNPAADVLMVKTSTGYVPIDTNTAEGKRAMIDAGLAADPTIPPAPFGGGGDNPGDNPPAPGKRPAFGAKPSAKQPKPPAGKPATEKHVHAHVTGAFSKAARRSRRIASIPFDRPTTGASVRTITRVVYAALQEVAVEAAKTFRDIFSDDAMKADGGKPTKAEVESLWRSLIVSARFAGDSKSVTLGDGSTLEIRRIGRDISGDGYTSRSQFRYTPPGGDKAKVISSDRALEIIEEAGLPSKEVQAPIKEAAAQVVADRVDISALDEIVPDVADALGDVAKDAGGRALAQIGPDDTSGLVDVVNERAVDNARQMAAELVGMRYNADGELVEAKRAEYRIDESTRNMIRETIAAGLEDNVGVDEIADNIEESTGFSRDRAELIANTEVRRANSMGALEGYQEGKDAGVNVQKEWMPDSDPCPICQENADQGPIDLDEIFESGDDAPPAHPNCECAIAPVVVEPESSDEE